MNGAGWVLAGAPVSLLMGTAVAAAALGLLLWAQARKQRPRRPR